MLGHFAVQAVETHAGINSLYEAAYHAIPIVAVPLVADQPENAVKVQFQSPQQQALPSAHCSMLTACCLQLKEERQKASLEEDATPFGISTVRLEVYPSFCHLIAAAAACSPIILNFRQLVQDAQKQTASISTQTSTNC